MFAKNPCEQINKKSQKNEDHKNYKMLLIVEEK